MGRRCRVGPSVGVLVSVCFFLQVLAGTSPQTAVTSDASQQDLNFCCLFFFFNLLSYLLGVVGGGCSQHCGASFPTSTGGDPVSPFPRWVSGMAVLSLCLFAAPDLCCVHSPAGSAVPSVSLPRQRLDVAAAAAAGGSILSSRMVCWELGGGSGSLRFVGRCLHTE